MWWKPAAGAAAVVAVVMAMRKISYAAVTRSPTAARLGIDNSPPDTETAMRLGATMSEGEAVLAVLQRFDPDARVTSGYRSPPVNKAVGGALKSFHQSGLALDFGARWSADEVEAAGYFLRDNLADPSRIRTVLAEHDHLHIEFKDPLGELPVRNGEPEDPNKATRWIIAGAAGR